MASTSTAATRRAGAQVNLRDVIAEQSLTTGKRIARAVFRLRGNRAEAHITEAELVALLALAAERGRLDALKGGR